MKVFDFSSHDGEKIYMYLWADVKEPKGVVQLVHGMSEHMDRYTEFAQRLNAAGYIVVGDDHRAHGKTAGELEKVGQTGIGDLFTKTVKDIQFISANTKNTYPDLPYFIIGHSYGSFLLQRYLELSSRTVDGAILMGTALMKGFNISLGRFLNKFTKKNKDATLFKKMTFDKYDKMFEGEKAWLSRNLKVGEAYKQDPFCTQPYSYAFYRSLFYGLKVTYRKNELEKIDEKLPIVIMSGTADPVGGKDSSLAKKLYSLYKEKLGLCVELKLYDGARHELHNETCKDEVYNYILDFLGRAVAVKQANVAAAEKAQAEAAAIAKAQLEAEEAARLKAAEEKAAKAAEKNKKA